MRPASGRVPASPGRESGFVLAVVVFMLFAISVAAATGYTLVSSEFALSRHSGDGAEALAVARAGLERYVAESLGTLADTTAYALGGGIATVTPRKLFELDSLNEVWYVRSEGTVEDVRSPGAPARRVVGAYATYRRRPIPHYASVIVSAEELETDGNGEARGFDHDSAGDCPGGGASTIIGAIAQDDVDEDNSSDIQGNPQWRIWPGGASAILDSIRVRWDILTDPDFPVEFENTLPNFSSIPSDSFPVVRYNGDMTSGLQGRGALIVTEKFDPPSSFNWSGIVLAGEIDDRTSGYLDGILIAGLNGPNPYDEVELRTDVNYHSCDVYAANESLSYLELMPNTIHETN